MRLTSRTSQAWLGTICWYYFTLYAGAIRQGNVSFLIIPLEKRATDSLRDHNITILPADKTGATVFLDRDAYILTNLIGWDCIRPTSVRPDGQTSHVN